MTLASSLAATDNPLALLLLGTDCDRWSPPASASPSSAQAALQQTQCVPRSLSLSSSSSPKWGLGLREQALTQCAHPDQQHLPAIAHNTDTLDLVALYSRSLSSAQQLQLEAARFHSLADTVPQLDLYSDDHPQHHSLATLLARDDLDAVAVCLPIPHQPAVLLECLRARKHVLSEKPIAPTLDRALELVHEYERDHAPNGVHWLVAEQFPHAAAWEKARQLVRDGKLGRLVGFDADVFIQPSLKAGATNWRRVPDYQGGCVPLPSSLAFLPLPRADPHAPSRAQLPPRRRRSLFCRPATRSVGHPYPDRPVAVSAHVTQLDPALPPTDTLRAVLRTSDPKLGGTLVLSFGTPQPSDAKRYTFRGTDAVLTVDLGSNPRTVLLTLVSAPPPPQRGEDPLPPRKVEIELPAQTAVEAEFAAFAATILGGGADSDAARAARERSGPRAALRDLAAVEAALRSGERGGERVALKDLVGDEAWEVK